MKLFSSFCNYSAFLASAVVLNASSTCHAFQSSPLVPRTNTPTIATTTSTTTKTPFRTAKKVETTTTTTPSFSSLFSPPLSPPSTTRLQASPLTTLATSTPLGAITVLASVVLVHEAGHYLAARSFNISVDEFSVGFGPKLLGFSALGNEFNLRGLPLGGYVKFPENYNITLVEQQERAAERAFQQRREQEQWTITQEILNLATFGQWDERRRVKKKRERMLAMEGQAPPNWLQNVLFFRRKPVAAQEEEIDPEDFEIEYYEDPNLLQNRPWIQRAIVLVGGVVFNMILAYTIYFGEIRFGNGLPKPVFDNGVVVSQSPNANAPAYSKLQQGDVIVGINGNPIVLGGTAATVAQKQVTDVITAIRQTPSGDSISLQINRNNQPVDVTVTPKRSDPLASPTIGVMLSPNLSKVDKLRSSGWLEASRMAYSYFYDLFSQTLDGTLSLLKMLVMGKGPPPGQSVSGPIGLIKTGTEVVSTQDWTAVFLFAAALSVNLGVINALPLPALDGGQLVFVLAEAITGRKVDQRFQEGITSIAVLFLLLVSISTAFSDVGNILAGGR